MFVLILIFYVLWFIADFQNNVSVQFSPKCSPGPLAIHDSISIICHAYYFGDMGWYKIDKSSNVRKAISDSDPRLKHDQKWTIYGHWNKSKTLTLDNVTKNDEGAYVCWKSNGYNITKNITIYIDVAGKSFHFHKEDLSFGSQSSTQWKYLQSPEPEENKVTQPYPTVPRCTCTNTREANRFWLAQPFFRFWPGDKHSHRHRHFISLCGKYMLSHTAKKCKENEFLECSATIFSSWLWCCLDA